MTYDFVDPELPAKRAIRREIDDILPDREFDYEGVHNVSREKLVERAMELRRRKRRNRRRNLETYPEIRNRSTTLGPNHALFFEDDTDDAAEVAEESDFESDGHTLTPEEKDRAEYTTRGPSSFPGLIRRIISAIKFW